MSKVNVLFVSSGNIKNGLNPIINLQGESLRGEDIEIFHFLIFGKGIKGYLKNIFKLKRYLSENHIDIVHAHFGFCGIVSYFGKGRRKVIVSLMGDDILGAKDNKGSIGFRASSLAKINAFFANHLYDFVIFKSEEMQRRSGFKGRNFSIIPNGVNLKLFHEVNKEEAIQKLGWDNESQHIIFMTNPVRMEKNFRLVEKSTHHLQNQGYLIKLHIVYSEPSEVLKYYYSAADVLLLSSFHEGSPNVIKEAMSCNCPIVSTDVGDVKGIIDNVEGCYISTFDSGDFSNKIKLALDFSKNKKRTEGVYKIKELGLDSETISLRIKKIYQNLISQ